MARNWLGGVSASLFVKDVTRLVERLRAGAERPLRFSVRRPDDLLVFDLLFENLQVDSEAESGPQLRKIDPAKAGILIVEFPPQSFGEEAFTGKPSNIDTTPPDIEAEKRSGPTVDKVNKKPAEEAIPLVRVRMSGNSRIAFVMDPTIDAIPFTLDAVLDAMRDWPMNLDSNALPDKEDNQSFFWDKNIIDVLQNSLAEKLVATEPVNFKNRLASAARRIANESIGGITAENQQQLSGVIWAGILRESTELFAQNPELREGDFHLATLATLALESANNVADVARQLDLTIDPHKILDNFPYVSFWLGFPHEPAQQVTALELPYRLILSPIESARWRHSILPRLAQGLTELWHTRLTVGEGLKGADASAKVRAIWSPDYPLDDVEIANRINKPFRMSLDTQDRKMLVNLMGNYRQKRADIPRFKYIPRASHSKRLQLSALGGLLDLEGEWALRPIGVDLEQWRHLATLGRDHYVRVVYSGFLLPFGHAASLVKITERKFEGPADNRIAVLRQRFFIIVRERVRQYDGHEHEFNGRNFPFTRVEILTRITPDLNPPVRFFGAPPITDRMAFWPIPLTAATELRFEVAALDRDNHRVVFSLPMLFISEIVNRDRSLDARTAYNGSAEQKYRETEMGGASIRFDKNPGDSALNTNRMSFAVGNTRQTSTTTPNFHPQMHLAEVGIPALQKLLGRNSTFTMQYPAVVVNNQPNAGQLFLAVQEGKQQSLTFGGANEAQKTDALGGLAAPQMEIYGLSKLSGPVSSQPGQTLAAALQKSISNQFNPTDFFSPDAKLIGGISLRSLFNSALSFALNDLQAPKLLSTETPEHIETHFEWAVQISQSDPLKLLIPSGSTRLSMRGETRVPITNPQAASRSANAVLEKFKLNLFGCIILDFDKLAFTAKPGQKPDVSVQLNQKDAIKFGGPLEFVNDLRKFIPSNGFSDPPALSVTPSGISAGYSLGLPTIGVGIFSLSNVTLGAQFNLPFDNRPVSVRFNFAERERPFSLTVSLLGGGGFFAATVGSKGVQEIEAALEFGAAVSLNLVVASGMVEIKAGVYFNWKDDADGKRVVLAGYVRIHGELTVVAIFSASLTFNLQLAYENRQQEGKPGQSVVWGEAELIVEVEVVFISFSVPVRCRKEFGGGEADPKFLDLMDQTSWTEYCAAFAPEEV